jgi:hypothetical protein
MAEPVQARVDRPLEFVGGDEVRVVNKALVEDRQGIEGRGGEAGGEVRPDLIPPPPIEGDKVSKRRIPLEDANPRLREPNNRRDLHRPDPLCEEASNLMMDLPYSCQWDRLDAQVPLIGTSFLPLLEVPHHRPVERDVGQLWLGACAKAKRILP